MPPSIHGKFDQLFRDTYPRVLAYLMKISGNPEVAEDIAQNIYLQLWENKFNLPEGDKEILYYLFAVARNSFFQHTRNMLRDHKAMSSFAEIHPSEQQPLQEATAYLQEKEAIVAKALADMEPQKVRVFLMNKEDGLNYKEIAEREGISIKTVMRYVASVSRNLRARLTSFFFW